MTHPATFEIRPLPEEASVPLEMGHPDRATPAADEDPCTAVSLFSALLDLMIAFLFLSGATISYLTSKFIRFFGLQPPRFDRVATRPETRHKLQKPMLCDRLPMELRAPSHWFFQEEHIKKCGAGEPCSPSTSFLEFDSLSSLELTRRNQLYCACGRRTPQPVRKRCTCMRRPYSKQRETRNYDQVVTAVKGDRCCETCPSSSDGQSSSYNGTIRRQLHQRSTKRKLDRSVLEDFPDLCRVSNDGSMVSAEAEGVHQLEREHSLKVFPEDLTDFCVWNQENEGKGFVKSSQDLGGPGSIHHHASDTDSTKALETTIQQYPDKREMNRHNFVDSLEDGFQLTGEYLGFPAEPLVHKVQYEGAREPIYSANFCETKEQSALKTEEPGNVFDNGVDDSNKRMPFVQNGNLIDYSTIPGDERLKSSWSGIDDDSIKLYEKLAVERETLNTIYVELETERTAAASAADEAMAMITRLQKEKAALQLEAMQYRRMAEEKAMYEEEATGVLRNFLFEREVEKLCLEKEIELYRIKSANQRELRDETVDAPLVEPEQSKGNGDIDAVSDYELWKKGNSYEALSGHKTRFLSTDSETLLESLNHVSDNDIPSRDGLSRQDSCMANHSGGDRSSKTWKGANDEDQSNNFRAAALHDRSYSSMRVNGHEITSGLKSRGTAERQKQHILQRIWNLEKQVHWLKTQYNLKEELSLGTLSGHGKKQKPLKGRRTTSEFSQYYDSSAKQSVYHKDLGINEHDKGLIKADQSEDAASLRFSRTDRIHNCSIADGTPEFVSLHSRGLAMNSSDESARGSQVCSQTADHIKVLDPVFEREVALMESKMLTQQPSEATPSPSVRSSLEPESFLPDERTTYDYANEDSRFLSTGVALSNLRESKSNLKEEVQTLVSRLQELEDDREVMRQIMESMQKEKEGMELLELGAQQLKLLHDEREGCAVCDRAPGTSLQLHDDDSFIEAEKFKQQDQRFNQTLESNQPVWFSGKVIEY